MPATHLSGHLRAIAGASLWISFSLAGPVAHAASREQTNLWTAGQGGYHTDRIPALLVTAKSSVLAFCEGRKSGAGDPGDVELVMKRSPDGGRSWSPHAIVHEEGGEQRAYESLRLGRSLRVDVSAA